MKLLPTVFVVSAAILLAGCTGVETGLKIHVSERANPWTHLDFYNQPANFQFAIVADRTGGHRPGVFADAVEKLNLLKPEFVMCIGDLIEGYTQDNDEISRRWDEFDAIVNKLQMPFFYVPGNNDITNETMAKIWQERLGRSYYHFVYRNVLFCCLNTEDTCNRCISDEQIEYFREVLADNADVRWTLIFMHQPMWRGASVEDWKQFESLLAGRDYTVFAGHLHRYVKSTQNGRTHYILATTGGRDGGLARKILGPTVCQFDHVVWVTMTDDGPVVANLLLEGILNDDPCLW